MRTRSLRSDFASIGFVSSMRQGSDGVQRPRQPHSLRRTRNGPKLRKLQLSAAALARGPSADGTPGPTLTTTCASGGSASSARNASQRPGSAARASRETTTSCRTSSSVASRSGRSAPAAERRSFASTLALSMRWSKLAKASASRRTGPPSGWRATRRGAGVAKLQLSALASVAPRALFAPAATWARKLVAIGKRPVGSKTSVRVPTQRHSPSGCGSSRTGSSAGASRRCASSATIGCENVTETSGASGTLAFGRAPQHSQWSLRLGRGTRRVARRGGEGRAHGAPGARRRQRRLAQRERKDARLARERREPRDHAGRLGRRQPRRGGACDERRPIGGSLTLAQPKAGRLGRDLVRRRRGAARSRPRRDTGTAGRELRQDRRGRPGPRREQHQRRSRPCARHQGLLRTSKIPHGPRRDSAPLRYDDLLVVSFVVEGRWATPVRD